MYDGRRVPWGFRNHKIADGGSEAEDEGCSLAEELDDYLFHEALGWIESAGAAAAVGTAIVSGVGAAGSSSRAGATAVGFHAAIGTAVSHSQCHAEARSLGLSVGAAASIGRADSSGQLDVLAHGNADSRGTAEAFSLVVREAVGVNCPRARKVERSNRLIEKSMADAVAACYADGIREPGLIRERVLQARNRAKERLCLLSSSG
jgi:hypothetical protein